MVSAHPSGATALAIDHFEGRLYARVPSPHLPASAKPRPLSSLITGGATPTIHLWDLAAPGAPPAAHRPRGTVPAAATPAHHARAVTALAWFPFDAGAFTSSAYDHALKIYAAGAPAPAASFALGSPVLDHAFSPLPAAPGGGLLAACATRDAGVRLVDLASGAVAQTLRAPGGAGAAGATGVAWSPRRPHALASACADGAVRLWDVRRGAACLAALQRDDTVGPLRRSDGAAGGVGRMAHEGACTGIAWTPDGQRLVSAGTDERIRVWDAATGADLVVHFGPSVRNRSKVATKPVVVRSGGRDLVLWPNQSDILVGDLDEGKIVGRLRARDQARASQEKDKGSAMVNERVAAVAWRGSGYVEVYSAHAGGAIRAWSGDPAVEEDGESDEEQEDSERQRKRKALDEMHRELTRQKITFT